jgi:hypothetical protein
LELRKSGSEEKECFVRPLFFFGWLAHFEFFFDKRLRSGRHLNLVDCLKRRLSKVWGLLFVHRELLVNKLLLLVRVLSLLHQLAWIVQLIVILVVLMCLETRRRVPTSCFPLVLPLVVLPLTSFHLLLLLLLLKPSSELTLLLVLIYLLLLGVRRRIKNVLFIRNRLISDWHLLLVLLHHHSSTH